MLRTPCRVQLATATSCTNARALGHFWRILIRELPYAGRNAGTPFICFEIPRFQVLRESNLLKGLVGPVTPNVLFYVLVHLLGNSAVLPATVCEGDKIGVVVAKRHGCNPIVVLAIHIISCVSQQATCAPPHLCHPHTNGREHSTTACNSPVLIATSGTTRDAILECSRDVASAS